MLEFNSYYMLVALAVRERANCKGRKVGAVFVKGNRIIATGYNGTPEGMINCEDGGCIRCKKYRDKGELYDKCICVHAEQNAIISAARFGHSIENATIYTTLQPCFSCLKELLQAKVQTAYYLEELHPPKIGMNEKDRDFIKQYQIISNSFEKKPRKMNPKDLFEGIDEMKSYLKSLK